MLLTELLRVTVLVVAGIATMLAAITLATIDTTEDSTAIAFSIAWWTCAVIVGGIAGARPQSRPGSALAQLLAGARSEMALPDATPAGVTLRRLWPLGAFAVVAGLCALIGPQIPSTGAGFALLWALAWRRRESAIAAIEDRDGVRFFVRPTPAHRPLEIVRVPGFGGERKATVGDAPVPKSS